MGGFKKFVLLIAQTFIFRKFVLYFLQKEGRT